MVPKISVIETTAGNTFSMGHLKFYRIITAFNILREVVPFLKFIYSCSVIFPSRDQLHQDRTSLGEVGGGGGGGVKMEWGGGGG